MMPALRPEPDAGVTHGGLGRNVLRMVGLQFLVAFVTCILIGGIVVSQETDRGARLMADRLGADILFVPQGYEQKSQRILLRGEPSSFYLPGGLDAILRQYPEVKQATPQLFAASLRASCCAVHVQLIGIDPETDFVVAPWMTRAKGATVSRGKALADFEVIVGSGVAKNPGESIRLFGKDMTVVAKLDATGMGFDSSVFMSADRVRRLLVDSQYREELGLPEDFDSSQYVSSVLVSLRSGVDAAAFARKVVNEQKAYALDHVAVDRMLSDMGLKLRDAFVVFCGLAVILWGLALFVLGLAFSLGSNERKKKHPMLRADGAYRPWLAALESGDSLVMNLVGGAAGVSMAGVVLHGFNAYIRLPVQLPSLIPDVFASLAIGAAGLAASVLAGPMVRFSGGLRNGKADTDAIAREGAAVDR